MLWRSGSQSIAYSVTWWARTNWRVVLEVYDCRAALYTEYLSINLFWLAPSFFKSCSNRDTNGIKRKGLNRLARDVLQVCSGKDLHCLCCVSPCMQWNAPEGTMHSLYRLDVWISTVVPNLFVPEKAEVPGKIIMLNFGKLASSHSKAPSWNVHRILVTIGSISNSEFQNGQDSWKTGNQVCWPRRRRQLPFFSLGVTETSPRLSRMSGETPTPKQK